MRSQYIQRFAIEQDLEYMAQDKAGLLGQLNQFRLFKPASRKLISDIAYKTLELGNFYQFDYQYTQSTGKSSVTHRQTVVYIESKELSLPQFYQKPENFFTRLGALLGFKDIDFINFTEYSDKFHLVGEFESVVRYYFTDSVLNILTRQQDVYMEGMNYYFILYQFDILQKEEGLKAFKNLGMLLYDLFKSRSIESESAFKIETE